MGSLFKPEGRQTHQATPRPRNQGESKTHDREEADIYSDLDLRIRTRTDMRGKPGSWRMRLLQRDHRRGQKRKQNQQKKVNGPKYELQKESKTKMALVLRRRSAD